MAQPLAASGLDQALRDFARDISGNDPASMAHVEAILKAPPKATEEVGFYGVENASAEERKFRATIFRLNEAGHILAFEDKYIHEMIYLLQDMGWMDQEADVSAYVDDLEDRMADYENDTLERDTAAHLGKTFAAHTQDLDAAIKATGQALRFIDVPLGDTIHLVQTSPEIAAKWRNIAFVRTAEHSFAVTDPQWWVYYEFLAYSSLSLPKPAPSPVAKPDPKSFRDLTDIGYAP